MREKKSGRLVEWLVCLIALWTILPADAANNERYPNRPIKIVVPYPPGNASDTVARIVAEQLVKRLGQPVVVENRPGASGGIGAQAVARAPADGYTMLMTSTSLTINTALTQNLMYDVDKDFDGVALLTSSGGMLLLVQHDFPADNVGQLVDLLKRNPGKYNYAQAGRGTIQHLTMESFLAATGTKAHEVSYKGSVQGINDMIGGHIQLMFDARGSSTPFVQAGKIKALAVSSEQRLGALPELPTVKESGLPGLGDWAVAGWTGMLAPKGTPKAIVDRLNKEIMDLLKTPEVISKLAGQNMEALPSKTPPQVQAFLHNDMNRWQSAATAAKLEKQ